MPGLVAFQRSTTCWPGSTRVSPPPPSAPVDAWKSILCSITLSGAFFSVSSI
ncbi:MAG: hypothetical protein OYH76_22955 [Defluviicoccus sp.]|nr:hypothetical protein [Defluviicoccus sp.]MDE0278765.1 hypothetical protein [Defluviicoccus sp.]